MWNLADQNQNYLSSTLNTDFSVLFEEPSSTKGFACFLQRQMFRLPLRFVMALSLVSPARCFA